ncbi:MAG: Rid family detoxifying hydrolase [Verrucomicrobiae bacterium]|nr:Rid family detoxifying hydrolase [Verrucomicrobiae bacterium]
MTPDIELVTAAGAPEAIGPYSHAAKVGNLLFCSGQIPIDPETKAIVPGGIEEQTRQVLTNIKAVMASQGVELSAIAKTTIFLTSMSDFPTVNGLYAEAFGEHKPARSTIQVAGLPLGSLVEIECIAVL